MRREHDFYPTPSWATRELLKRVDVRGSVLEPCSGRGDISHVLEAHRPIGVVVTNDLDTKHTATLHMDAADPALWTQFNPGFHWCVTNPPFSAAHKILPLAWQHCYHVAMLLRITYLEPCEGRAGWMSEHPPSKLIVLPRISFTGDGKTDNVTCAWFVWDGSVHQTIEVVNPKQEMASLLEASA